MKTNILLPKILAQRVRPANRGLATQPPEQSSPSAFRHPILAARRRSERLTKSAAERVHARAACVCQAAQFMDRDTSRRRDIGWWRTAADWRLSLLREMLYDDRHGPRTSTRWAEGGRAYPRRDGSDQAGQFRARSSSSSRAANRSEVLLRPASSLTATESSPSASIRS